MSAMESPLRLHSYFALHSYDLPKRGIARSAPTVLKRTKSKCKHCSRIKLRKRIDDKASHSGRPSDARR